MYRQITREPPSEFLRQILGASNRQKQPTRDVTPHRRVVDDASRLSLLTWAEERDKALNQRRRTRQLHLASRHQHNPHDIRVKYEFEQLRSYDESYSRMTELLLDTDWSLRELRELRELRWIDIHVAPNGLMVDLTSRRQTVAVEDGTFDGVPVLSLWVFDTASLSGFERG
jgi:hypothetical protein